MENLKNTIDYTNTPKVLEVKNLRVNFTSDSGMVYAVRGVSFDLYKGETLCIVGESGSGKSVTSKTIMGILAANAIVESGQIIYEGEDLVRVSEEEFHRIRGHKIGMIFQDPLSSLNPIVRVGKQITEATLINKNILKRHYNDLIKDELIAYRNLEANKVYEFSKIKQEKAHLDKYLKELRDTKNPITDERRDHIGEAIYLFIKDAHDTLEVNRRLLDQYRSQNNLDNTYLAATINETRIDTTRKKINVLEDYCEKSKMVEEGDKETAIALRIEFLNFFKESIGYEFKTLNPILKKALSLKKKDANVENKEYALSLKNEYEANLSAKEAELAEVQTALDAKLASISEETRALYDKMVEKDEKKGNFFTRLFKKEKQEEINITKLTKQEEKVKSTNDAELDALIEKKSALENEIEEIKRDYINKTKVTKAEARKMALNVMKEVGIPLPEKRFKQYPFEFSGGMRQRIVIAIALTANPDILICDEPTTALDVTIQAQILELINKLKHERGLSCIFITHDLGVVANMADRVAVMYAGKIVEYGTSYEIFFNPKHPYTWALLSSIPDLDSKEKLEAIPGTPPDMRFPPKGDAFALRSKYALEIDFKYEPPFFKVSDTHYAATWLLHEDAPEVQMPKIVETRIANSINSYKEDATTDNDLLESVPLESKMLSEKLFSRVDEEAVKEGLLRHDALASQLFEEGKVNIDKETSSVHSDNDNYYEEHREEDMEEVVNIVSKCKTKKEYVDQKVILSVNHLKQYFFFGKGINKYKLKAVHDVNFQVKEGECFGIVGESGCGKTTTGRSIIRLYHITSGSIYYKGQRIGAGSRWNEKEIKFTKIRYNKLKKSSEEELNAKISELNEQYKAAIAEPGADISAITNAHNEEVARLKEEVATKLAAAKENKENIVRVQKAKIKQIKHDDTHVDRKLMSEIQMIFQDPIDSLDPRMTVEDIIQEGLIIQGFKNKRENHEKVVEALEKVGLIADYCNRYPHEFSGGQRQRIGIARALIMNPKLLICDEPISALDVSIRAQIINLLNNLKEEMGLTIIFIAHDLSVVKYFCDRIAVMYFGEIVELASSDELFKHPLHPYTKSLLSAIPKPNPLTEKGRKRITYNPRESHDYSVDKPKFVEIVPNHFILANETEIQKYKEEIEKIDSAAE